MSYSIEVTAKFERQIKRLIRKFPSLKKEYAEFILSLKQNPFQGTSLGNHSYKVRIAIGSKGKGKSGGGRIITHVHIQRNIIYMLSIYDKSEQSTISEHELNLLLKFLP